MKRCPAQASWYSYFKENMDALGLSAPTTWYGGTAAVTATLSTLVALSEKFGPRVTVGELIQAGTKGEVLAVVGSMSAAWYLGAAIGSAAVATGNYTSCGTRISDVFTYAATHRMLTPRIKHQLVAFPEIYDVNRQRRHYYGMMARIQT